VQSTQDRYLGIIGVLVFQGVLLLLFLLNSIENLFQMFRVRWLHFSYFGIIPLGHAQR
jgi:hypothetical protein